MDITPTLKKITAGALLAGGLAVSGLGPPQGSLTRTKPSHWCPGNDPTAHGLAVPTAGGTAAHLSFNPTWDGNVCHLYSMEKTVAVGIGCPPARSRGFSEGTAPTHSSLVDARAAKGRTRG